MEQEGFDWLTNALATECSRRSVLRGLIGGGATGLFTPLETSKVGLPVVASPHTPVVGNPIPLAEKSLYLEDQAVGWDGWPEDEDGCTYADELLFNDGLGQGMVRFAPYQPEVADYAVEADIRFRGATGGMVFYGLALLHASHQREQRRLVGSRFTEVMVAPMPMSGGRSAWG